MDMASSGDVLTFLASVRRLPEKDQDLLVDFISLLTKAPPLQQESALAMLGEVLEVHPDSHNECVNELTDIIYFLRSGIVTGMLAN